MKSQDILLLLKLVVLTRQEQMPSMVDSLDFFQLNSQSWKDWGASDGENAAEDDLFDVPYEDLNVRQPYREGSVRGLSQLTGIGKSEVSNALARCYFCGLARPGRDGSQPSVNTKALLEFLIYGIKYVFPVNMSEVTRGIATCLTAPIFDGELRSVDKGPVWPYAKGSSFGPAVEPLYKSVPIVVNNDPYLYAMLALVDSIRLGLPRERNLAIKKLEELLRS